MSYNPKDIHLGDEGRAKLISGIHKMASAVKSTLGPMGNTVLIESTQHTHGKTITKDGVTVARSIQVEDPVENIAMGVMREAAERTATEAGDGTTTSIVIAEALITQGYEYIQNGIVRSEMLRYLDNALKDVLAFVDSQKRRMSKKMLIDVATISANNDRKVGKLIADVYHKVGRNGVVTVEMSKTHDTYYEATAGAKLDVGYLSPAFVNDQKRDECILENAKVFLYDGEITSLLQMESFLKPVVNNKEPLLIVADCNQALINTFAANVIKNGLRFCIVPTPSFGYRRKEIMSDLAVAVGAKLFGEHTGDDLSLAKYDDLGVASRVSVGNDSCIVIPQNPDKEGITKRVAELKGKMSSVKTKKERDFILRRIATLDGGIGVIYAGGATDIEQKELFDRIDDAVCAVRAAVDDGVVPGGGQCLDDCNRAIAPRGSSSAEIAAYDLMRNSIKMPKEQIFINGNVELVRESSVAGFGKNVLTGESGFLMDMGIVDPAKVTKQAVINAVSVAKTILSTDTILTFVREK